MTRLPTHDQGETPAPLWRRAVFIAGAAAAVVPWSHASPQLALMLGIALALLGLTAFNAESKKLSRILIQACVVLLGLRLDLRDMARELAQGGLLAIATVVGTLALGLLLGWWLRAGREVSLLVSSGTAICGGSAIAAVGASVGASSSSMAVSTAAIFVLNAVGLMTLPWIGRELGLTAKQFGVWAGISLHDIASVAGAGQAYDSGEAGAGAADTAMIVKLTRVIWITPIALAARAWFRRSGAAGAGSFPWFILAFLAASAVRTFVPAIGEYAPQIGRAAGVGFQLALFLIGAGLSVKALRQVGWRALVQATVLWLLVAAGSLAAVRFLQ